jgi:RHS repeat-associated protein
VTITYNSPAPGTGQCPSSASTCETIKAASGRTLIIGSDSTGQVTSVTDPLGRTWTYAYNSNQQLTSATSPMSNVTSYTYGQANTRNTALASDLLTITSPNAQPGGPDAGDATVNVYDGLGRVITQTDPAGWKTTFNYCVNPAAGDCMNPATGTGYVSVTDPEGYSLVYDYQAGDIVAQTEFTSGVVTSENDYQPDLTAASPANPWGGTLLNSASTDGDGITTTYTYDAFGDQTSATTPSAAEGLAATTSSYTSLSEANCEGDAQASSSATCSQDAGPTPVAPGGVIISPSSAPPEGLTYSLFDTDGNELYSTTGVYEPGSSTASYLRTTYQLFNGNSLSLNGTSISCAAQAPTSSLPCVTVNADGIVTQLGYDSVGDLTTSSTPDGNGSEVATTTYSYDADGEQTSSTLPDGNLAGANSGNFTTVTTYNADGQKTAVTIAGGSGATVTPRTTLYSYDGDGNQVKATDPRGYATATTFNADDQATLVTNPDGDSTLTCYDPMGRPVQIVPPAGVAADGLTPASCPTSYPAGYGDRLAADATVTVFNAEGQETSKTTPAPAGQSGYESTIYAYNGDGQLTELKTPQTTSGGAAEITVYTYGSAGQLASQTTGYGTPTASTTTYCYDPEGAKTAVVAPDGNTSGTAPCEISSPWTISAASNPTQAAYQTTYSYNSVGELVSSTTPATAASPGGATNTSTYDPAGNILTSTDPDDVSTTTTYTPGGQEATVSYSGSSAPSATYSYDADGNMTTVSDGTGKSTYAYDSFGELTSAENGAGQTLTYAYDADSDVTAINYPLPSTESWATSNAVTYGYDNADQLTSVTDFNSNKITITNNSDEQPSTEVLGSTGDTVTTSYDSTSAVSAITLANSSSTLQSFSYSRAPAGDIVTETDTPSSATSPVSYGYDAQSRVTSFTPGNSPASNYAFDASGNLTALPTGATGTYNDAGELTTANLSGAATSYTYSADGERLTATQGTSTTTATWNGARQLTSYDDSTAQMADATYNSSGQRTSATFTPVGGGAVTENYLWGNGALLMDSANAYIYTRGTAPAEQVNLSTGSVTYLVTDSLGSVRGAVGSSGALTGTTSYDAWGNPHTASGLTAITPFGFTGSYTDPDGLIYLINRYYDPATGQFTSVDPDLSQTQQSYEYTGGDPVNATDSAGESPRPEPEDLGGYSSNGLTTGDPTVQVREYADMEADSQWEEALDIVGSFLKTKYAYKSTIILVRRQVVFDSGENDIVTAYLSNTADKGVEEDLLQAGIRVVRADPFEDHAEMAAAEEANFGYINSPTEGWGWAGVVRDWIQNNLPCSIACADAGTEAINTPFNIGVQLIVKATRGFLTFRGGSTEIITQDVWAEYTAIGSGDPFAGAQEADAFGDDDDDD